MTYRLGAFAIPASLLYMLGYYGKKYKFYVCPPTAEALNRMSMNHGYLDAAIMARFFYWPEEQRDGTFNNEFFSQILPTYISPYRTDMREVSSYIGKRLS